MAAMDSGRPAWAAHFPDPPDTLSYHLVHGGVTFDQHVKAAKVALAREVLGKRRIYLDQNYWIHCRDAMVGRAAAVHQEIFQALRNLVKGGMAVCPVAHPVLEETFKQSSRETRAATARVVDELSRGIAIEPFTVLTQLELFHFLRSTTEGPTSVLPAEELAWTWPAWLFGIGVISDTPFDPATERAVAKAVFDSTVVMPFSAVVEALVDAPLSVPALDSDESQRKKTEEARSHRHEFATFDEVFLTEIAGGLDALREDLEGVMAYLFGVAHGRRPTPDEVEAARGTRPNLADLVYSAFKHDKIGPALPGIRILSGIHAAVRYRDQPYRKGDAHDHLHARIALPYCSMFLTEKNLGNLLTNPPLDYGRLYGCHVLWNDAHVLDVLRGMA